jgi:hypothetical protein
MKTVLLCVAVLGLILTVTPSFFVLYGIITWTFHVQLMFVGMILWFGSAPLLVKAD